MVQFACWVVAALVVGMFGPMSAVAGDVFTGYQIDNKSQYFSYLGIRAPLPLTNSLVEPFVQFLGAGLGYSFKVNGQLRDANVQFAVPALGLKMPVGDWSVLGFAGPQFRRREEENGIGGSNTFREVGAYVQGEVERWREADTVHALLSYTDLDRFVMGRVRATQAVQTPAKGCCVLSVGWDVAGMGNKDFFSFQSGPLVQIPIAGVYATIKGGYQYSTAFHNGAYGGFEIYFAF